MKTLFGQSATLISAGIVLATAVAAFTMSTAWAQQPQTQRVHGTIERVDGNTLFVKGRDGTPITLRLAVVTSPRNGL